VFRPPTVACTTAAAQRSTANHHDDATVRTQLTTMKRKQAIQPAPQVHKSQLCPCGVDYAVHHECRWRPTFRDHEKSRSERRVAMHSRDSTTSSVQQKRIMIIGSLPSRRRKQKAASSPTAGRNGQVMLKGMPLDVFHAEPFNAYPIPTIGVVHRMAEHCTWLSLFGCSN
jgi:hypothetical protein